MWRSFRYRKDLDICISSVFNGLFDLDKVGFIFNGCNKRKIETLKQSEADEASFDSKKVFYVFCHI